MSRQIKEKTDLFL